MTPTGLSHRFQSWNPYLVPDLAAYLFEHTELHRANCSVSKCPGREISLHSCRWLMPFHESCL